jgi:peptide deformylase
MKKILQQKEKPARPHDTSGAGGVLRQIASEVRVADIKTKKIKTVLKEMSEALASQDDGVAIAAPQIGYPLRIFVVSGKIFAKNFAKSREEILLDENNIITSGKPAPAIEDFNKKEEDLVFINPKISKCSKEKEWVPEGCLSVRWLYGKTQRSKKATITAYDEKGKKFTRGASGLLAQIFQHETDHLDGILFIDHAKDIREELPQVK